MLPFTYGMRERARKIPFELSLQNVVGRKAVITGYYSVSREMESQNIYGLGERWDGSHSDWVDADVYVVCGSDVNVGMKRDSDSIDISSRSRDYSSCTGSSMSDGCDEYSYDSDCEDQIDLSLEVNASTPTRYYELKPLALLYRTCLRSNGLYYKQLLREDSALLKLLNIPDNSRSFALDTKNYPTYTKNGEPGFVSLFFEFGFAMIYNDAGHLESSKWRINPRCSCLSTIKTVIRQELSMIQKMP
eukprot:UN28008